MHSFIRSCVLATALASAISACHATDKTESELDSAFCPQTFEFGNYGCTRIVGVFNSVPISPTDSYFYSIRIQPAIANSTPLGATQSYRARPLTIDLTLWQPITRANLDTMSAWVVARTSERVSSRSDDYVTIAADSVLRIIRFARVGEKRTIDTVSFDLVAVSK